MKKTLKSIWVVSFLILAINLQSQQIVSEKTAIFINNKAEVEKPVEEEPADKVPPSVSIMNPPILEGQVYTTEEEELQIFGQISDVSGISYALVNSEDVEVAENGTFVAKLKLYEGENKVKIIAVDNENNLKISNFTIEYSIPIVTLADRILKESTYYGLIIGCEDYIDPSINDLDKPIRDAKRLKDVLTRRYYFEEENITFLENPTRRDIFRSFDELSKKVTPDDNLLIFYAGHGYWDKDSEIGYWLPSDAEDDLKSEWFRNSALVDYLREVKSKHTLLITDACFGGSIFKTRTAFSDASKLTEEYYNYPSRKAMTSGNIEEVPDESAFVKYLIMRLEENQEDYLRSEKLFSSFEEAVYNNSNTHPKFGEISQADDQGGDFIFLKRLDPIEK